ncbi:MAG: aminopeptidase [Chloroflexi bacterium]|nr:MAG: aminopeptidase [Chloroflexota bacterium]
MRARDLGIEIGFGQPGPYNAITDVAGVRVGHASIVRGDGPLVIGSGPVRTGVTVIFPRAGNPWEEPVFAGCHRLNGNGELTGLEWIREAGVLSTPIGLTNTNSVGVVRDTLIAWERKVRGPGKPFWALPVVGETYDGALNDIDGMHVTAAHVYEAIAAAHSGPVGEGCVGGGTGMICHEFKGGIGTASRVLEPAAGGYTVGVLVQANYGRRKHLRVNGVPVGLRIPASVVPSPWSSPLDELPPQGSGSIIAIVATDAPLLPVQCDRMAQRATVGVARMGGGCEDPSGDIFLAFSTGNAEIPQNDYWGPMPRTFRAESVTNPYMTALFDAVAEATEEAILNAMLAATTMVGRDGITSRRLDPDLLLQALGPFARLA